MQTIQTAEDLTKDIEIEVKYEIENYNELLNRLYEVGAKYVDISHQKDVYFWTIYPENFLRLRVDKSSIGKNDVYITAKGSKLDEETKSRHEVELELAEAEYTNALNMLTFLGYMETGRVSKKRRHYILTHEDLTFDIAIDDVEKLEPKYCEVELTGAPHNYEKRKKLVLEVAGKLGLKKQEKRGYFELVSGVGVDG